MATISNVNGKKITKIKYKGEIFDTGGGGTDWLKEFLDETHDASYLFCGQAYSSSSYTTWHSNLTYERLQKILSYNTTSSVTSMAGMFFNCSQLTSIPSINTSLVANMSYMFNGCSNLTTIPQLDTSKVTDMSYMFNDCISLTTMPQLDTRNVTNMSSMFSGSNLTTISQLDTSKVTDMGFMFSYCSRLATIDISLFTSSNNYFAYSCKSLTKLIIRNMPTIPVLAKNSFEDCYHFDGTPNMPYNPKGLRDGRIYVPDDKVEALKTATNWSVYADIIVPLSTLVE